MPNRKSTRTEEEKKAAAREAQLRYEARNPGRRERYYEANKERLQAEQHARYLANREEILEKARVYHEQNREHRNEQCRIYQQENSEALKPTRRRYYEENAESIRNAARVVTARRGAAVRDSCVPATVDEVFGMFGSCAVCGAEAEQVDHVVPRSRGGCAALHNLQWLCTACNYRKRTKLMHEWLDEDEFMAWAERTHSGGCVHVEDQAA